MARRRVCQDKSCKVCIGIKSQYTCNNNVLCVVDFSSCVLSAQHCSNHNSLTLYQVFFLPLIDFHDPLSPPDLPSPMADRTLKLVTRTIQNLANLAVFKQKEAFMVYLNPFITKNMKSMKSFVNQIAVSVKNLGMYVASHVVNLLLL